jgi:hypothetical protein
VSFRLPISITFVGYTRLLYIVASPIFVHTQRTRMLKIIMNDWGSDSMN